MTYGERAFTLVELMVVLAVSAIALSISLPDLRAVLQRYQLEVALTDLHGAIMLARSEAIGRGESVTITPRDTGGADWAQGWTIFIDRDGDLRPGSGDDTIALHGPVARGISIATSFTGSRRPDYLAYNSAGRSCGAGASMTARWGTFSLYQGEQIRRIKINMLGRARSCDPARDGASCSGAEEVG